jgi:hypothetical protein
MKKILLSCIGALALALAVGASPAAAQGRKLSDAELDNVSAGNAGSALTQIRMGAGTFSIQGKAGSTQAVKRNGLVFAKEGSNPAASSNVIQKKGLTAFNFQGPAGSTHTVSGNGTISYNVGSTPTATTNLLLQGDAQQNLRSLVNIAAVNSKINVLVNLNVNINSTVGAVGQANSLLGH